jgi:hypothetical protein
LLTLKPRQQLYFDNLLVCVRWHLIHPTDAGICKVAQSAVQFWALIMPHRPRGLHLPDYSATTTTDRSGQPQTPTAGPVSPVTWSRGLRWAPPRCRRAQSRYLRCLHWRCNIFCNETLLGMWGRRTGLNHRRPRQILSGLSDGLTPPRIHRPPPHNRCLPGYPHELPGVKVGRNCDRLEP